MAFIVDYKNKKWSVEEIKTTKWVSTEIYRTWFPKEEDRSWYTYSLKSTPGDALNEAQPRILAYLEERENPIALAKSVIAGREEGCKYEELFHELSKAVVWLDERLRDIERGEGNATGT